MPRSTQASLPTRVLQLTDSHLLADPAAPFRGVNPHHTLRRVVRHVLAKQGMSDLLLATGDLAQDGSAEAYAAFLAHTQGVAHDTVWVPGNHDEAAQMRSGPEALNRAYVDVPGWRIVCLDSTVAGQAGGALAEHQWQRLQAACTSAEQRAVLVVLHHHLMPCGSAWMDQLMVHDAAAARHRLQALAPVRAVLCGHIHQPLDQNAQGIRYLGTPSTSVQFKPEQQQFMLDTLPPGYRWLQLWPDGTLDTDVAYVNSNSEGSS